MSDGFGGVYHKGRFGVYEIVTGDIMRQSIIQGLLPSGLTRAPLVAGRPYKPLPPKVNPLPIWTPCSKAR